MRSEGIQKKLVAVYIPAYNEENTIGDVIRIVREAYAHQKEYYVKIIVVDDGSKDKTGRIAKELNADYIVTHPKNMGLGAATRSGLRQAYDIGADIAVKLDADFQHDPLDIDKVVRPILEDKSDVVFGSRFMGKIEYKMPLYRRIGNSFFSRLTEIFTGLKVTDAQTGLIATNRRYLKCFRLTSDYNETQQMIIDTWRNQLRFMEVPVVFHKRKSGKSFISWKYPFVVFSNSFRLFIHACPLKIFLPIGFLFLFFSLAALYMFLNGITRVGEDTVIALFIGGLQIVLFGLIADIISKKR